MPEKCSARNQEEFPQAEQAADHAVRKVFAILGVDIDKPESVEEFREDLRFGKKLRRVADHSLLALSATLDRVRITTVGGADTFDAGLINITSE